MNNVPTQVMNKIELIFLYCFYVLVSITRKQDSSDVGVAFS